MAYDLDQIRILVQHAIDYSFVHSRLDKDHRFKILENKEDQITFTYLENNLHLHLYQLIKKGGSWRLYGCSQRSSRFERFHFRGHTLDLIFFHERLYH